MIIQGCYMRLKWKPSSRLQHWKMVLGKSWDVCMIVSSNIWEFWQPWVMNPQHHSSPLDTIKIRPKYEIRVTKVHPEGEEMSIIVMTCWHFCIWGHKLLRRLYDEQTPISIKVWKSRNPFSRRHYSWQMLVKSALFAKLPTTPCTFVTSLELFVIKRCWRP